MNDTSWVTSIEHVPGRHAAHAELALPPERFHCRLDDQPDHLLPEHLAREIRWPSADRRIVINPECVCTVDTAPPELPFTDQFALQGGLVWIRRAVSGRVDPFWLGQETLEHILKIQSGECCPDDCLSPAMLRVLLAAGVLVELEHVSPRSRRLEEISAKFQERAFAPVSGLLHPFHVSALRRYYRHLIRMGGLRFGDSQSARRYVAHNESVARYFHHQLAPMVSAIVQEPVKPSYVYVASYQGGADLEKHTDREQCEFSLSFCLDFSPEPHNQTSWPLLLHTPRGLISVYQRIGDALLYRGMEVPHSRNRLGEGKSSTSIFFHYVRETFEGTLD